MWLENFASVEQDWPENTMEMKRRPVKPFLSIRSTEDYIIRETMGYCIEKDI